MFMIAVTAEVSQSHIILYIALNSLCMVRKWWLASLVQDTNQTEN